MPGLYIRKSTMTLTLVRKKHETGLVLIFAIIILFQYMAEDLRHLLNGLNIALCAVVVDGVSRHRNKPLDSEYQALIHYVQYSFRRKSVIQPSDISQIETTKGIRFFQANKTPRTLTRNTTAVQYICVY